MKTSLNDSEERLMRFEFNRFTAAGPAMRELHAGAKSFFGRWKFRAFVERHHDVGSESALDLHGFLWRDEVPRAIDVRLESHTFFRELIDVGEREDLVATGVCEDGPVPAHELVKATHLLDELVSWF